MNSDHKAVVTILIAYFAFAAVALSIYGYVKVNTNASKETVKCQRPIDPIYWNGVRVADSNCGDKDGTSTQGAD